MDKGRPFRIARPIDDRAASRPEPVRQSAKEALPPEPAIEEAPPRAAMPARTTLSKTRTTKKKRPVWLLVGGAIVVIGVVGWLIWSSMRTDNTIDSSKYQAVSTTDGQIYFGKLSRLNDEYVKLTSAYYLQAQVGDKPSGADAAEVSSKNDVKLIKLSNKIYGPEDEIVISKNQVLSYENLRSDGQVAKWLKENDKK